MFLQYLAHTIVLSSYCYSLVRLSILELLLIQMQVDCCTIYDRYD